MVNTKKFIGLRIAAFFGRAIISRRSIRKFTHEDIPRYVLKMILKCGYYAPNGHNMQSWRLTVIEKNEDIQRIKEATELAASRNKVHFYGWENPKILVLVSNDERNEDGCQYASTAAENIMLAAISFGVGSVWINPLMKLRKISPVKEVLDDFGVPDNHVI